MRALMRIARPRLVSLCLAALSFVIAVADDARADPETWKQTGWARTDFTRTAIDLGEIVSGGPPKDGIPSIDAPRFEAADTVEDIPGTEPVIRLEIGGDLRGYPLRVMMWHEIVNDTVGGVPVAVTYCPLCNSAIAFERIVDGKPTTFGTTGKLRNSDLVMYDRATESWWQQFTGEAIVGARTGDVLKMLPVRVVSFDVLKRESGDAKILQPALSSRPYGANPYEYYDSRAVPYPLFTGKLPKDINPMARVVVVRDGGSIHAVTLTMLRENGHIDLDGIDIAWTGGVNSALDTGAIAGGRDVGAVRVTKDGRDLVHDITFAFAFHAFHPDIAIAGN